VGGEVYMRAGSEDGDLKGGIDLHDIPWSKIAEAVEVVQKGIAKRVDIEGNIVVYKCGTVIRIDIK